MTPQPLVSIIIPTYNRAHLVDETLDSVLAQTYQNWECIVVDDGSTDTTDALMQEYLDKDSRFRYYHRPKDRLPGGNAARNYGFEMSKGEFVQWFDSDDLMHPEKLTIKMLYALSYDADVIIDKHSTKEFAEIKSKPNIETLESRDFYVDFILGKRPVITNDVMIRATIVGSLRFDEKLHKAQEYEFFTRLFDQKLKYCFLDLTLTLYRESDNSISKNTFKGNSIQVESLIYLSKLIKIRHAENPVIVERAERQGRKMYKVLIRRRQFGVLFKHYNFFKRVCHKSSIIFFGFLIYNTITDRGFDRIKPKYNKQ